jgi:hypothetical protein
MSAYTRVQNPRMLFLEPQDERGRGDGVRHEPNAAARRSTKEEATSEAKPTGTVRKNVSLYSVPVPYYNNFIS